MDKGTGWAGSFPNLALKVAGFSKSGHLWTLGL